MAGLASYHASAAEQSGPERPDKTGGIRQGQRDAHSTSQHAGTPLAWRLPDAASRAPAPRQPRVPNLAPPRSPTARPVPTSESRCALAARVEPGHLATRAPLAGRAPVGRPCRCAGAGRAVSLRWCGPRGVAALGGAPAVSLRWGAPAVSLRWGEPRGVLRVSRAVSCVGASRAASCVGASRAASLRWGEPRSVPALGRAAQCPALGRAARCPALGRAAQRPCVRASRAVSCVGVSRAVSCVEVGRVVALRWRRQRDVAVLGVRVLLSWWADPQALLS